MNITQQINDYNAAQDAAKNARQQIINRLNNAATIISNIRWKKFSDQKLPASLEWTRHYDRASTQLIFTEDEQYPISIKYGDQVYRIESIYLTGSTWDIAKHARTTMYEQRYRNAQRELSNASYQIRHDEDLLSSKLKDLELTAKRKIKEIEKDLESQLQKARNDHKWKVNAAELTAKVSETRIRKYEEYVNKN